MEIRTILVLLALCLVSSLAFGQEKNLALGPGQSLTANANEVIRKPLIQQQSQEEMYNYYIAPQIAVGGGYSVLITISNPSPTPVAGLTFNLWNQDGQRWDVHYRIIRERYQYGDSLSAIFNPGVIFSHGHLRVLITDQSAIPLVGSAAVLIPKGKDGKDTLSIQIEYLLANPATGSIIAQAAVLPVAPSTSIKFHANRYADSNQNIFRTGIAIANSVGNGAISVNCTVFSGDGVPLESAIINLAPVGQTAKFVEEMFPSLPVDWTGGLVQCTAPKPVSGMTLEFTLNQNGVSVFSTGTTF